MPMLPKYLREALAARTAAGQKPAVDAGWLPPHRVERLRTYLEHLASEGAASMEAAIVSAVLDGEDPDY